MKILRKINFNMILCDICSNSIFINARKSSITIMTYDKRYCPNVRPSAYQHIADGIGGNGVIRKVTPVLATLRQR